MNLVQKTFTRSSGKFSPIKSALLIFVLILIFNIQFFCPDTAQAGVQKRIYVPNVGTPTVHVVEADSNAIVGTITLTTSTAVAAATSPNGTTLYVLQDNGRVSVYNTSNNQFIREIDYFSIYPTQLCIVAHPGDEYLYIGEEHPTANSSEIIIIRLADDAAFYIDAPAVNIGASPRRITFTPNGTYVYVADSEDGKVRRFEFIDREFPDPIIELPVAALPDVASATDIEVLPNGSHLVSTVGASANSLRLIQNATPQVLSSLVTLNIKPQAVAVSPDSKYAYVLHYVPAPAENDPPVMRDPGRQSVTASDPAGDIDFQLTATDDGLPDPPGALAFSFAGSVPFSVVVNAVSGTVDLQPRGAVDIGIYPNQSFCVSDSAASNCVAIEIEIRSGGTG